MVVRGNNCLLRPVSKEDSEWIYSWFNNKEIINRIVGFRINFSLEKAVDWCVRAIREDQKNIKWIIESNEEVSKPIGFVGLYNIDLINMNAEIAIIIGDKNYWGHGIGKESLKLVCDFGFKYLRLKLISAQILSTNEASLSLFKKVGFKEEGILKKRVYRNGTWHDIVLIALLLDDWEG